MTRRDRLSDSGSLTERRIKHDRVVQSQDQRLLTTPRRQKRSRRLGLVLLLLTVSILLLGLIGPTFVSRTSLGRSLVIDAIAAYGFDAELDELRLGWVTPISFTGVHLRGQAKGSEISAAHVDIDMTLMDLLRRTNSFGTIALRDISIRGTVGEGSSSLEDDLRAALVKMQSKEDSIAGQQAAGRSDSAKVGNIELTNVQIQIVDELTERSWDFRQASSKISLTDSRTQASFTGVLAEPSGRAGTLQGAIEMISETGASVGAAERPRGMNPSEQVVQTQRPWRIELISESLPLSVIALARRRLGESFGTIPAILEGDATGKLVMTSGDDGSLEATLDQFQIRNLSAAEIDPGTGKSNLLWRNELASVDGQLSILRHHVVGRGLTARSDFAVANLDGIFSRDFSWVGAADNPLRWLEGIHGEAHAEVDLAKLQVALPGVLPIRSGARLDSGLAIARVTSKKTSHRGDPQISELMIKSNEVRATAQGRQVVIDPISLSATVVSDQDTVRAEEFRWVSEFGSAVGEGSMQSGRAEVDIDFGKLARMLRPIVDFDEAVFSGQAEGNIRWSANERNRWQLSGVGVARDLSIGLSGGEHIEQASMKGEVEAIGIWENQSLSQLRTAAIRLSSEGMRMDAELVETIDSPSFDRPLPLQVKAEGEAKTLFAWLRPWLPPQIQTVRGSWRLATDMAASSQSIQLENPTLVLSQPLIVYNNTTYAQPKLHVELDGTAQWPEQQILARRMVVSADAFSAVLKGQIGVDVTDCEMNWRAKLERLGRSTQPLYANRSGNLRSTDAQAIAFQPRAPKTLRTDPAYWFRGDCEGSCTVRKQDSRYLVSHKTEGRDLVVMGRHGPSEGGQPIGADTTFWSEPSAQASGTLAIDFNKRTITSQPTDFATDWLALAIAFDFDWGSEHLRFHGDAPAKIKMDEFAKRASKLAEIEIQSEGIHETELQVDWMQTRDQDAIFTITGDLGWSQCQLAGMELDQAAIPFLVTETNVEIDNAVIPIGSGRVIANSIVHYDGESVRIEVKPGTTMDRIELTPEVTDQWMKYIAPVAADATRVNGVFSAEFENGIIDLADSRKTNLNGRLNIANAKMTSGPLANQMFGGINQLIAFTGGRSIAPDRTLVTMPPQTVDFRIVDGIVAHERLYFNVDRVQVVTSGRVRMSDSSMEMIAQIPIDERWLGRDLKGLTGQTISLPITGTLSRPSVDSRSIVRIASELGSKAIQTTAENYLQRQLEKGLDKVFGN